MHACMTLGPACNTNAAVRPFRANLMVAIQGPRDHAHACRSRSFLQAMVNLPTVNLPTQTRPVYTIDLDDRLALVNPAAVSVFAPADSSAAALLGRAIWDFIPNAQIRQLWQVLYSRVRAAGVPVFVPMRADTPSLRRLVDLELHPLADRSIQHIYECVWTEA